ncbi:MAG: hypothetical protein DCC49_03350 [Acidobacteria bacterium]|nr:MAG: hypothetical protein DCC49_03350 [Acidobacteriota bacterium]
MSAPEVKLRQVRPSDFKWLIKTALKREFAGVQYSWIEWPLQPIAAPVRAAAGPFVPACVIIVDGELAGYIGRSPLSGNLEYFLLNWAQGRGVGRKAISEFLAHHRAGDKARKFVIRKKNKRSLRVLQGALDELGWSEKSDYKIVEKPLRTVVEVGPG